jgi:hypothetical protein
MIRYIGLVLLTLILLGCGESQRDMQQTPGETVTSPVARVEIHKIGTFTDKLAYEGGRGIYTIVDKKTGTEFIGISGIGISETGVHNVGKSTVSDER